MGLKYILTATTNNELTPKLTRSKLNHTKNKLQVARTKYIFSINIFDLPHIFIIKMSEFLDFFLSIYREPCCGTHVMNTSDINDFCIVGVKSLGRSTASIVAVSGPRAKIARQNGAEFMDQVDWIKIYVNDNIDKVIRIDYY